MTNLEEYASTHILPEKVDEAAFMAYRSLLADARAFIDYQPGDATSYKLTMTRIQAPMHVCPNAKPSGHVWGCVQDGSFVMVGWMDHGCYPFAILGSDVYFDPGYVADKFDNNIASGLALATLFNRIAEVRAHYDVTWQRGTTEGFDYYSPALTLSDEFRDFLGNEVHS